MPPHLFLCYATPHLFFSPASERYTKSRTSRIAIRRIAIWKAEVRGLTHAGMRAHVHTMPRGSLAHTLACGRMYMRPPPRAGVHKNMKNTAPHFERKRDRAEGNFKRKGAPKITFSSRTAQTLVASMAREAPSACCTLPLFCRTLIYVCRTRTLIYVCCIPPGQKHPVHSEPGARECCRWACHAL